MDFHFSSLLTRLLYKAIERYMKYWHFKHSIRELSFLHTIERPTVHTTAMHIQYVFCIVIVLDLIK